MKTTISVIILLMMLAWFQNGSAGDVYGFEGNAYSVRLAADGAIEVLRDGALINRDCRWR